MTRNLWVFSDREIATTTIGDYLLDRAAANPRLALGGATGRSPIDVWAYVWSQLHGPRASEKAAFVDRPIVFLDEYFGAYPAYYHWAHRNLKVGRGGFPAHHVYTPRGCFFEFDRVVDSERLEEVLEDNADQWESLTALGEDGVPPEIRFHDEVEHPLLREIQQSMNDYDKLVRQHANRLQLLGIGVGGAIDADSRAGGHIGFVEYGAASPATKTMLVRMASSTLDANRSDFQLTSRMDGTDSRLQTARFAITQGISTILSAGELLLMAWGKGKSQAVERMICGTPSPFNPAAWVQEHSNVTVVLDEAALGELSQQDLESRGWSLQDNRVAAS